MRQTLTEIYDAHIHAGTLRAEVLEECVHSGYASGVVPSSGASGLTLTRWTPSNSGSAH